MSPIITLPIPPDPVGAYEAGMVRGGIGFISGQFPLVEGVLHHKGRIAIELTEAQGRDACKFAALNALAQIKRLTDGFKTLDGLLRLEGYVASAKGFVDQPQILDVASKLFVDTLGERGRHARTVIAVPHLPLNASIELCVSFKTSA